MKELQTESLEKFAGTPAAAASGTDGSTGSLGPAPAPASGQAGVEGSAPQESGGGGGGTPPSGSDAELLPGMRLGRYKIIRRLGEGGMSAVFEAVHVDIHKPVAIKVLSKALAQQEEAQVRFLREAAAASRLQHPHVVDVADFGTEAGRSYLVMELMRGEDLSQHIQRVGPMTVEALANVMLPICAGVQAAHDMRIVHRDLKPQNIFLCRTTMGGVVPKVLDFGISKVVDSEAAALTHSGMMMGTPYYLSPEQIIQNSADHRSDQYALGVILYECSTGRRPHEAETLYGILNSITQGSYPRPRAIKPELPEGFENVILRTLSSDAARRFPSVHALGRALMSFASERHRMIWSDYFDNAQSAEALENNLPTVAAPAAKSGSTEILSDVHRSSLTPAATRMLPEGMGMGSGALGAKAGAKTGAKTGATTFSQDPYPLEAPRRFPLWALALGGAVLVAGIAAWALSGSDKGAAETSRASRQTGEVEHAPAAVPAALPSPVTTQGASAPAADVTPPSRGASESEALTAEPPPPQRDPPSAKRSSRGDKHERAERNKTSSGRSKVAAPEPPSGSAPAAPADGKKRSVEKSGGVPILE